MRPYGLRARVKVHEKRIEQLEEIVYQEAGGHRRRAGFSDGGTAAATDVSAREEPSSENVDVLRERPKLAHALEEAKTKTARILRDQGLDQLAEAEEREVAVLEQRSQAAQQMYTAEFGGGD